MEVLIVEEMQIEAGDWYPGCRPTPAGTCAAVQNVAVRGQAGSADGCPDALSGLRRAMDDALDGWFVRLAGWWWFIDSLID